MAETLTVAMPHCGLLANSTSGGEVVERELLWRVAEHGVNPHILRPVLRGLRWWNSAPYFWRDIRRCVRSHAPRVIRAHSLRYAGPAAIMAKRRYGLPLVAHFHHLEADRLAWLDRWVLRQADVVTTDSTYSQNQAAVIGICANPIPLGAIPRWHPRPAGRLVLFLGGDKPRKNLPFLLGLWPEILRHVPDARLVIAGPGHWVPRTDADIQGLYRRARVLAFPSRLEGFGLPVLEAMAVGRPVVCSDQGALPELGAESTVPLEPFRWVAALINYLVDDAYWDDAAHRNFLRAQEYSWERTAQLTATAWQRAAA